MSTNASFIYYYRGGDFGRKLDGTTVQQITGNPPGTSLEAIRINDISYTEYFIVPEAKSFRLKTTYPGLLLGTGYNHPAREQGDFQMGFFFDHSTGMPVIPGSTIKGMLKSVFPKNGDVDEIKQEKLSYVRGLSKLITGKDILIDQNNWERLFEKGNFFFDAYISGVPSNSKVFAEDYITPHKNIFKDPIPIRFLKIAPNVTFTFQFQLIDSCLENNRKISFNEKLKLFEKILLYFGIGAKRNVGYGNLTDTL